MLPALNAQTHSKKSNVALLPLGQYTLQNIGIILGYIKMINNSDKNTPQS